MAHRSYLSVSQAVFGIFLVFSAGGLSADPGELFPDVPAYDEKVSAPVSRPEAVFKRPVATPESKPVEITPRTPDAPVVSPTPVEDRSPVSKPVETPRTSGETPAWMLQPYSVGLLDPFLDPDDQETFDKKYANTIAKALNDTLETRRKASAEIASAAKTGNYSSKLKRYLLLHALALSIRGTSAVDDRAKLANAVLPMLEDRTLAVTQARADCLNDLLLGTLATPSERLLDMNADALTMLAILQVQGGFPQEAAKSLKKAREAALRCREASARRSHELAEASAWVDRSTTASAIWPRLHETLTHKPEDPFANTQCAIFHIVLYGHLENAARFASKSDKPEIKLLSEKINQMTASDDARTDPAKIFEVCLALGEVAKKAASHNFDKFSIALFTGDQTFALMEGKVLTAEQTAAAKTLLASMKDLIDKGTIKPGYPPEWLGGEVAKGPVKLELETKPTPPKATAQTGSEPETPAQPERTRRGFGRWRR
jgi:hypothetical protein